MATPAQIQQNELHISTVNDWFQNQCDARRYGCIQLQKPKNKFIPFLFHPSSSIQTTTLASSQTSNAHVAKPSQSKDRTCNKRSKLPRTCKVWLPQSKGYKAHLTSLSYMLKPRYFICLITLPHHNHFHADLLQRGSQCSGGAAFSSCLCLLRAFCSHGLCLIQNEENVKYDRRQCPHLFCRLPHTHLPTCRCQSRSTSNSYFSPTHKSPPLPPPHAPLPPLLPDSPKCCVLSLASTVRRRWAQGCGAQPPPPASPLKDNAVYCICQASAAILCKSIAHLLPRTLSWC